MISRMLHRPATCHANQMQGQSWCRRHMDGKGTRYLDETDVRSIVGTLLGHSRSENSLTRAAACHVLWLSYLESSHSLPHWICEGVLAELLPELEKFHTETPWWALRHIHYVFRSLNEEEHCQLVSLLLVWLCTADDLASQRDLKSVLEILLTAPQATPRVCLHALFDLGRLHTRLLDVHPDISDERAEKIRLRQFARSPAAKSPTACETCDLTQVVKTRLGPQEMGKWHGMPLCCQRLAWKGRCFQRLQHADIRRFTVTSVQLRVAS